MLVGGGGYTIRNVARCWTNETAIALGLEVANGNIALNYVNILKCLESC